MNFESTYANPMARTSRGHYIGALIVLVLVAAFYQFVAKAGRNGDWVLITLLFPGFVLLARRLHDMGQTAWLLVLPLGLNLAAAWLHLANLNPSLQPTVNIAAAVVTVGFMIWGLVGKGQAEANKFGEPAAA